MMKKIGAYLVLVLAIIVSLFPFYFMVVSGTNTNGQVLSAPPKLTFGSNLGANFAELQGKLNIWRVVGNSLLVAICYTLLAVLVFSLAGYALAKFDFKGKAAAFMVVMLTMMIPHQVLYIPLFNMVAAVKMSNTYASIIFPALANAFGIFLMRQNMLSFPTSLIESARIDGYNELNIFFRIVMPNMKPALSAVGIYMFISSWNSFMWPLIILGTKDMYTFPVALAMLDGNPSRKSYAVLMLATTIGTLPIFAMFLALQKQFVAGIMGGAIKE